MRNEHDIHDSSPVVELETAGNGKSRKMRAGFATLAVLGLGAGITLAAWTGNVDFTGTARAGGVDSIVLEGAVSATPNVVPEAFTSTSVAVPGMDFTEASASRTQYLWVQDPNGHTLTSVQAGIITTDGDLANNLTVAINDGFTAVNTDGSTDHADGTLWRAPLTVTVDEGGITTAVLDGSFAIPVTGQIG